MFPITREILVYIDPIQNVENAKLISSLNDDGEMVSIFWDSSAKFLLHNLNRIVKNILPNAKL